jgi:hypothetical protein
MTVKKLIKKIAKILLAVILLVVILPILLARMHCLVGTSNDLPNEAAPGVSSGESPSFDWKNGDDDLTRPEVSTYLTYPEWYIVYSAHETANVLNQKQPSDFPYFGATNQYWQTYCNVYSLTKTRYPMNYANHVMLIVIGSSFSLENVLKGAYENTAGRVTEWIAGDTKTQEDEFAAKVSQDYAEFLHQVPWYEYPYWQTLNQLWRDTDPTGPKLVRKWERKIVLSLEYSAKGIYGWLIKKATKSALGEAELEIAAVTTNVPPSLESDIKVLKQINDQTQAVIIPRYEVFTEITKKLTAEKVKFISIAGNDEIMLTILSPNNWRYELKDGHILFFSRVLTEPNQKRTIVLVPVNRLHQVILDLEHSGATLEHIYDY